MKFCYFQQLIAVCLLAICLISFGCVTAEQKKQTKEIQEFGKQAVIPITEALRKFYADNRRYPENINELAPKYIENLPEASNNIFSIKFDEQRGISYIYRLDNEREYTIILSFVLAGSNSCQGGAKNGEKTVVWSRCGSAL